MSHSYNAKECIHVYDSDYCRAQHLFEDIPIKKRWELIKSNKDLDSMLHNFLTECRAFLISHDDNCEGCIYEEKGIPYCSHAKCFEKYLAEEIKE